MQQDTYLPEHTTQCSVPFGCSLVSVAVGRARSMRRGSVVLCLVAVAAVLTVMLALCSLLVLLAAGVLELSLVFRVLCPRAILPGNTGPFHGCIARDADVLCCFSMP